MSRQGRKAALEYAESLPSFRSISEAELSLFKLRDDLRDKILNISSICGITLDFSPESLKSLEKWYFDLCRSDGFKKLGITQEVFERCMGFYEGFVYTENDPEFKWIVEKNLHIEGKYQIGVRKGLLTIILGRETCSSRNNKRMQSIYRAYKKYST